ncbi:DUF7017 domain-containing protein [Algoriphagus sp.]|uniref:DUF7017 domain-containing protein n=1 Tax=Algoriphagus sp. TaxID=1872435 RepID=UPI0039187A02
MSTAEVKNLRNQNRYEDAARMSRTDLETNPTDIWLKRSHAWSLYYMIKKHVQAGQSEQARLFYTEFESLQMPEDETLIYERMAYFKQVLSANYISAKQLIQEGRFEEAFDLHATDQETKPEQMAWAMYYLLRHLNKSKNPDKQVLLSRMEIFRQRVVPQKLLVYKLLMQEFIKLPPAFWDHGSLSTHLEFLGLFDTLDEDDFEKQEYEGQKIISLAERLHIGYSKALIREKASKEKVETYLQEVVEPNLEPHRGMLYVPYFKAKLLLEIGDREEGMQAFLPFARRKQGEFWVWQVFAEYYQQDPQRYLSCLCKALSCRVKPEFLSNIKERLIAHLIQTEKFDWAKSELIQLVRLREQQSWGLRSSHREMLESTWFTSAREIPLKDQYLSYLGPAEQLLGSATADKSSQVLLVLVDYVNPEKSIVNFVTAAKKKGFGKFDPLPEVGEIYSLKGKGSGDGFYKIESLQKAVDAERTMDHLKKIVKGKLRKNQGQAFGFVSGTFVPPGLIQEHQLHVDDSLEGVAVFGPVKGKEEWAWRMVKLFASQ